MFGIFEDTNIELCEQIHKELKILFGDLPEVVLEHTKDGPVIIALNAALPKSIWFAMRSFAWGYATCYHSELN